MRRKRNFKRLIQPDPIYNSTLVAKFVNQIMKEGKKSIAQKLVYNSFKIIEQKNAKNKEVKEKDPLDVFDKAIRNVSPLVEIKGRRIGGANYQVPVEVKGDRKITLAFRWIINAARSKKGQPMSKKLAAEILDAAAGTGAAIKKKEDTHRMAEANKAFARFA